MKIEQHKNVKFKVNTNKQIVQVCRIILETSDKKIN